MTTNLPKLSSRAKRALEILADGGEFNHRLERNTYTGREQFQYRLKTATGGIVKGIGLSAFHELNDAGFLAFNSNASTTSSRYFSLRKEG